MSAPKRRLAYMLPLEPRDASEHAPERLPDIALNASPELLRATLATEAVATNAHPPRVRVFVFRTRWVN